MKAKYKAGRPEDNLTVGKKYDVEDVRCKKGFEASEVYLKNDKQQKCWYSVELFTMYAESALPLKWEQQTQHWEQPRWQHRNSWK